MFFAPLGGRKFPTGSLIFLCFNIENENKKHLTLLDRSLQRIPQYSWDFLLLFVLVCIFSSWSLSRLHRMPSTLTIGPICSNGHAFFWYSKIAISCLCIFEVIFPEPCCGQSKSIRHWTFKFIIFFYFSESVMIHRSFVLTMGLVCKYHMTVFFPIPARTRGLDHTQLWRPRTLHWLHVSHKLASCKFENEI